MKVSLFKDDKTTHKDEVVLSVITVICMAAGILLVIYKPAFWIISGTLTAGFGVAAILFAVMLIPCIIYRFVSGRQKTE